MSTTEIWGYLLLGLGTTLRLSLASMGVALLLGTLIGVFRVGPVAPLRWFAAGYVEFFRDIPLLPVLVFVYSGLPKAGLRLPTAFESAVAGLGVYTAAFVAEVVRAGLQSIHRGQIEAALSLGMSFPQMVRLVLLPQAFRMMIPPLGTVFIALVKNTSIASAIAVEELLYQAEFIIGRTFADWPMLLAFLLYLVITVPMSGLVNLLERRLRILF